MAPIPRYKREKIQANVQTEQLAGASEQAAAQGYGAIAREQKGLAAQHGQRAGQEIQSFAQKLNDFTSALDMGMRADATKRAQDDGKLEMAERRKKIFEIQSKYANDPKTRDKKIQELSIATEEDSFSVYGRIYQDQVSASHAYQTELDASNAAAMAYRDAHGNPELFKDLYKAYEEKTKETAPNKVGRLATTQAFEKHGVKMYEQMYTDLYSKNAAQNAENLKGNIAGLEFLIKDASSKGDTQAVAAYTGQLNALIAGEVARNNMGAIEGKALLQESYTVAQTAEFMRFGTEQANMGQGWDFISKLKNPKHPYGKAFLKMPVDVQKKILADMGTATKAYEEAELGKDKHEVDKVDIKQKVNTLDLKKDMIETGKVYSPEYLQQMVQDGWINEAQRKELIQAQDITSDQAVLTQYSDDRFLAEISADDIMNEPHLSLEDKRKLMDKRTKVHSSSQYDWVKSNQGKEVIRRIREDFDRPEGIGAIMAEVHGEKTPKDKAYAAFREELWDRVEALPFEKQATGVMQIYREMKNELKTKEAEAKKEKKESADANAYNEAAREAEEHNSKWYNTEKSVRDVLMEKNGGNTNYVDRVMSTGGKTAKPTKPKEPLKKPAKPKVKPLVIYKPDQFNYVERAKDITGWAPSISGKNVDLAHVRRDVKDTAYPVMKKHGLSVIDGFRYTPGNGANNSQHLHGNALDVSWAGKTVEEKVAIIKDFKAAGFKGFGIGNNTIHVDRRNRAASWSYIGGTQKGGGWMPKWAAQALRD